MTGGERPAAAILAGGKARRFGGRPKGLLEVGGTPILVRQLRTLREVADPVFLVASDASAYARAGVEIVPDIMPGLGTLGGIYTAIVRSPRDRIIVVGCDMPFLSAPLLRHMCGISADVVIPRSPRGLEPLHAVYTRACAPAIRERLARKQLEAAIVPEGLNVQEIGADVLEAYDPNGLVFVNINTPHDYERARGLLVARSRARQDRIMDDPAD